MVRNSNKYWTNIFIYTVISLFFITCIGSNDAFSGTYTSTKHGTDADRREIDPDFPYTTKGHCAHCHDQHASIDGSEPSAPATEGATDSVLFRSNYGVTNKNELCFSCHEVDTVGTMPLGYGRYGIYQGKTKYNASIHKTSSNMLWSPDASPPGPAYDDAGNCNNCHNPHGYDDGSGLIPQMLFARDSTTYEMGCEACHDGSATQGGAFKDVKAQLNKTYAHPTHDYNDRHVLPETGESEAGNSFGNPPTYNKRHAECVDCHNPHTVVSSTIHTAGTSGNAVSDVLKYVWGVEPSWPAVWTQPTSFTVRKPPTYTEGAQYEYQICFKCHSYYGLGTLINGVSTISGPSGVLITDQAWEFNKNNKSVHPVVVSLNNQSGSDATKALDSTQMKSPWTAVGTQTMYCSDCHGADNEGATAAKGPHGSTRKFMLKGTGQYWPTKSDGITLWRLNEADAGSSDLFCNNCHVIVDTGTWSNRAHEKMDEARHALTIYCVECHIAVPHGSKRSRLIGYASDVTPYNYSSYLKIDGFRKEAFNSYDDDSCYSSNAKCHPNHLNSVPPYNP